MSKTFSDFHLMKFPVTCMLAMAITCISVWSLKNKSILFALLLHPMTVVKSGNFYRLLSADLVHNDYVHLGLNLIMLFTYGSNLEAYLNSKSGWGSAEFFLIYAISCVAGSVTVTVMHRKDFDYSSAGASGSIMGCLFSYSILQPYITAFYLPVIGAVANIYLGLICIVGFIIYRLRTNNKLVNHDLHFFGALGGITTTLALFPHLWK